MTNSIKLSFRIVLVTALLVSAVLSAAAMGADRPDPDFTKGGEPDKFHDWTLGPTGARGWIYGRRGHTADARQILVTRVAKNSPADGILKKGDVILGVAGRPFDGDARIQFAKAITAVVGQRLVRKLCESCKEPYAPTPQVLQQLGIPEGRVQAFYRPPQPNPDERREPCEHCGGIGYFGRTAIFELLTVGDTVRKVLTTNPKLDLLRQVARKDSMKSLQEEGVLLVAKGVTSLPELMRVLKQ